MNGLPQTSIQPATSSAPQLPPPPLVVTDYRRFARRYCKVPARLFVIEAWDPNFGAKRQFDVVARNISRSGICFVFFRQLYPDDQITLTFGDLLRHYRVARCRRLGSNCYEIGASISDD
jgi:hypothetical protein